MAFTSHNMNYIFNVEYFKNIFKDSNPEATIKERNADIFGFEFEGEESPLSQCRELPGYREFHLYTLYPGLLVGTGNPHEIAVSGALKCGFTFDYVTGKPYITGSTLKGMLRSYFPGERKDASADTEYEALIKGILGREDIDVAALKENMFDNHDIFLGAFPVVNQRDKTLLEMEFITSHKEKFKNPNPISLIKVKPAVKFIFSFVLSDYVENGEVIVSGAEKEALCKELLLLMGIGAKTNVGFGRFAEKRTMAHPTLPRESADTGRPQGGFGGNGGSRSQGGFGGNGGSRPQGGFCGNGNRPQGGYGSSGGNRAQGGTAPICPVCKKKPVTFNRKLDKYNRTCPECFAKSRS